MHLAAEFRGFFINRITDESITIILRKFDFLSRIGYDTGEGNQGEGDGKNAGPKPEQPISA